MAARPTSHAQLARGHPIERNARPASSFHAAPIDTRTEFRRAAMLDRHARPASNSQAAPTSESTRVPSSGARSRRVTSIELPGRAEEPTDMRAEFRSAAMRDRDARPLECQSRRGASRHACPVQERSHARSRRETRLECQSRRGASRPRSSPVVVVRGLVAAVAEEPPTSGRESRCSPRRAPTNTRASTRGWVELRRGASTACADKHVSVDN